MPRVFAIAVLDRRLVSRNVLTIVQKCFNSEADIKITPLFCYHRCAVIIQHYFMFVCKQSVITSPCFSCFQKFIGIFSKKPVYPMKFALRKGAQCSKTQSAPPHLVQNQARRSSSYVVLCYFYFIGISNPPIVTETISSTGSGAENVKM